MFSHRYFSKACHMFVSKTSGLYFKHAMIENDASRVVSE
jgi:hypothetical protein